MFTTSLRAAALALALLPWPPMRKCRPSAISLGNWASPSRKARSRNAPRPTWRSRSRWLTAPAGCASSLPPTTLRRIISNWRGVRPTRPAHSAGRRSNGRSKPRTVPISRRNASLPIDCARWRSTDQCGQRHHRRSRRQRLEPDRRRSLRQGRRRQGRRPTCRRIDAGAAAAVAADPSAKLPSNGWWHPAASWA